MRKAMAGTTSTRSLHRLTTRRLGSRPHATMVPEQQFFDRPKGAVTRRKILRFPAVITAYVFEKIRSVDMTLVEFKKLLDSGEVIEEHELDDGVLHELVLIVEWVRRLHVAFVVDERRPEERIVTVYEPDPDQWMPDYTSRRS